MAETEFTIISGVRHEGTVYTPGMEKKFLKVATPKMLEHLMRQGAISGYTPKPAAPSTPSAPPANTPNENK